jgi:hypothetical protein
MEAVSSHREPMSPETITPVGAANVACAAADLDLSLTFCSMAEGLTREDLIRTAAYLHAESRSFAPGREVDDWFCAEHQVDHWLGIYGLPHHFSAHGSVLTSV